MLDFLTRRFRSIATFSTTHKIPIFLLAPVTAGQHLAQIGIGLTIGITISISSGLSATALDEPAHPLAQADLPPSELTTMLEQIDQAASREDLATVLSFYSADLQHGDGLTRNDLEAMLTNFWANYDNLSYSTQLTDWEASDPGFVTTTVTQITGEQAFGSDTIRLDARIESRQQVKDGQIVEQDILAESSQIQTGEMPPTVDVQLPETVIIGQPFYFDAIVMEPIGDSLLMGSAFTDPVSLEAYTTVPALDLNVLDAGGLFKQGEASLTPSHEWVSGLVIREGGITGVSQRLRVVNLSDR